MARPILMPQVGQDLTEGRLTGLNVKVGDRIRKGDIVAEVESEKAVFEVEAFETGTILEIRCKVGEMATVLEPLMMVGEAGEVTTAAPAASQAPPPVASSGPAGFAGEEEQAIVARDTGAPVKTAGVPAPPEAGARGGGSSPLARRLAAEAGVDWRAVAGSGPRGSVVKRDIVALRDAGGRGSGASVVPPARDAARPAAAGGLSLRRLQSGAGDPVLLLHGFGAELSAWRPFLLHLKLDRPVLALDLPAHGGAAGVAAGDFGGLVAAVRGLLAEESVERLHLVGHSLGAAVAAEIAGGGDFDVRSLSMLAPAGLGPRVNGDFVDGFLSAGGEAALKPWLELLVGDPSALPGVLVRATLAGREGTALLENQTRLARGLFSGNTQLFSVRDALKRFDGPMRAIVGREDRIIPADHADALPAGAALHRLPGVGHLPQLEAAALTGRLVSETVRSAG